MTRPDFLVIADLVAAGGASNARIISARKGWINATQARRALRNSDPADAILAVLAPVTARKRTYFHGRQSNLTPAQDKAFQAAGRDIATGNIHQAESIDEVREDYGFEAEGDWMYVREVARKAGVVWGRRDDIGPHHLNSAIWREVREGYRDMIDSVTA